MSTEEKQQRRGGLRQARIRGPWAYVIVAASIVLVLYAMAVVVSALT